VSFAKEFIERSTGEQLGATYEVSVQDLGEPQTTNGKVGWKVALTDFFKRAKSQHRRENPIAPNQADIVKWVLYDRFIFAAGTTVPNSFQFFTMPIGTNAKTKADTNLDQVQRLPDPLWFNTEGLGFAFSPLNTATDIQGFLASEYMEFWVGQKVYLEGPFQTFPGGVGLWGAGPTTQILANGVPRIDNVYDVRLPAGIHLGVDTNNSPIITDGLIGITILQGQQFRVIAIAPGGGVALSATTATPAGTGLTVNCYLYGIN
jgi:hypothetical protein